MASSGYKKSDKPELVAIYRLEFYKNKKKWKFCNEKTREKTVPVCESLDTERNPALDKTYSLEQHCDVEPTDKLKTSPLNSAFIHEIPSDDIPSPEALEPPPPPPTPQSTEGIWPEELFEHDVRPFQKDMWMKQELINNVQHQQWSNQGEPVDLQWLVKTSGNHPEEWPPATLEPPNQDIWPGLQPNLQKVQGNEMPIISGPEIQSTWSNNASPNHFYPAVWTNTPSGPLQNKTPLEIPKIQAQNTWDPISGPTLPQGPPANSLQMLLCPDKWKNQPIQKNLDPAKINPIDFTKPPPGYKPDVLDLWSGQQDQQKISPDFWNKPPPLIPTQLRKNPDSLTNNAQKINPDFQNSQTLNSWTPARLTPLATAAANIQKSSHNSNLKGISSAPVKLNPDVWPNKVPATWTNPALLVNEQNIWTNQVWQKEQDILQNKDQDWIVNMGEDVQDAGIVDEVQTVNAQPQYLNDHNMLPELTSPEKVRESAEQCLRRLLQVYSTEQHLDSTEHDQGEDTAVEFIREAHEVPHSSENDPGEVDECICSYMPLESLAGMSSGRLASVILHATKILRDVLKEQLIRDRLRNRRVINLEEYPTRDTDLFGCEYVLAGSHVPRNTGELSKGTERVIKIDMGRPYRL